MRSRNLDRIHLLCDEAMSECSTYEALHKSGARVVNNTGDFLDVEFSADATFQLFINGEFYKTSHQFLNRLPAPIRVWIAHGETYQIKILKEPRGKYWKEVRYD